MATSYADGPSPQAGVILKNRHLGLAYFFFVTLALDRLTEGRPSTDQGPCPNLLGARAWIAPVKHGNDDGAGTGMSAYR